MITIIIQISGEKQITGQRWFYFLNFEINQSRRAGSYNEVIQTKLRRNVTTNVFGEIIKKFSDTSDDDRQKFIDDQKKFVTILSGQKIYDNSSRVG